MPRGGARPGAGRKRKPIADLVFTGRYRPDQHGPLPATVGNLAMQPPVSRGWQPTEAERAELGPVAMKWLSAALAGYQFDPLEGQRVMQALRSLTRAEALERTIAEQGLCLADGSPHPALAALVRETRVFLSLWAYLRFERA